ncbi:MAG TPA: HEAT repeat domain-containing protein, partial [Ktedonobacterales bacterium]|nr:HEAT repeat domain-containing protein [Ktedonobacterales bacterium]
VPALIEALDDAEPLVRGHAAWALGRLGGPEARAALAHTLAHDTEPSVQAEARYALETIER